MMINQLISSLQKLDAVLEIASKQVSSTDFPDTSSDLYRGLQIRPADFERSLSSQPCASGFTMGNSPEGSGKNSALGEDLPRFGWLKSTFGLSTFDLNVILVALAPEVDLRYERIYAYLQDDVTRRRPTVDLALNLFAGSPQVRMELRSRFSADAPLMRHKLVHLVPDPMKFNRPCLHTI